MPMNLTAVATINSPLNFTNSPLNFTNSSILPLSLVNRTNSSIDMKVAGEIFFKMLQKQNLLDEFSSYEETTKKEVSKWQQKLANIEKLSISDYQKLMKDIDKYYQELPDLTKKAINSNVKFDRNIKAQLITIVDFLQEDISDFYAIIGFANLDKVLAKFQHYAGNISILEVSELINDVIKYLLSTSRIQDNYTIIDSNSNYLKITAAIDFLQYKAEEKWFKSLATNETISSKFISDHFKKITLQAIAARSCKIKNHVKTMRKIIRNSFFPELLPEPQFLKNNITTISSGINSTFSTLITVFTSVIASIGTFITSRYSSVINNNNQIKNNFNETDVTLINNQVNDNAIEKNSLKSQNLY